MQIMMKKSQSNGLLQNIEEVKNRGSTAMFISGCLTCIKNDEN